VRFRYFGDWFPEGGGVSFPTPIGSICSLCKEVFDVGDCGHYLVVHHEHGTNLQPVHRECAFREVVGGIGHLKNHEFWCVTIHDSDGGRSYRESALEVWDYLKGRPSISGMGEAL